MYEIRLANESDIPRILEIMKEAYDNLENKSWYYIEGTYDSDWMRNHLSEEGFTVVSEDSNNIVGFLTVRYPSTDNLGVGIVEDIEGVAHMETTAVTLGSRGCNLMCKMIDYAESLLDSKYIHLMATVHPNNYASLGSFVKCGYSLVAEDDDKYGEDLPRCILLKERHL